MGQVALHLKRTTGDTPQRVFALYHVEGKQVKFYTAISIRPQDWNKAKQRIKDSAINAAPNNDYLRRFVRTIESVAYRLATEGRLTPENLKHEVENEMGTSSSGKRRVLAHIDAWIEDAKGKQQVQTIKNYGSFKKHLTAFCKRKEEPKLAAVDKPFIEQFADYLTNEVGLVNTSRWNILKTFKTFLHWVYDKGETTNRAFEKIKKKEFHVVEPDVIRLTEEELRAIAELDFIREPALANARDLFLLQSSLGVRFSDLVKITPANIEGGFIRITTQKNRKTISIPLLSTARQIIERAIPPYPVTNQKLNQHLKVIAQRANINNPVLIPEFRGTTRKDRNYQKWELVTTHTAKRTFVSLMIARGVTVDSVMKITGNNRATIERYISLEDSELQADISKKIGDLL